MDNISKRTLANDMLKDQGIDFVSNSIPADPNYVEIPKEEINNYVENSNPSNNFNININVNGKTTVNNNKVNETQNIVKNIVQSSTTPEEIKKNSQTESDQSGNKRQSETEYLNTYRKLYEDDMMDLPNYFGIVPDTDTISPMDIPDNTISYFTYSQVTNKGKNSSFVNSLNLVKNFTKNILSDIGGVVYSPQNAITMQIANLDSSGPQYDIINNFSKSETSIEQTEKTIREISKQQEANQRQIETSLNQVKYNNNDKEKNNDMIKSEFEQIPPILKGVVAPENPYSPIKKEISSINDDKKSTINIFNMKTNNPPSWRIVLG